MNKQEHFEKFKSHRLRIADLRCELEAEQCEIDLLETQLKLGLVGAQPKPTRKSKTQRFIDANDLTDQEIEFISKTGRNTLEVGEFLGIHRNQVSGALRSGQLKAASNDMKGKRMIDTISVIESQFGRGDIDS